jgi:hypothetical protein
VTLYRVNMAVVRFWDTHAPTDAIAQPGDKFAICADCLIDKRGIPPSNPGVHQIRERRTCFCIDCGKSN